MKISYFTRGARRARLRPCPHTRGHVGVAHACSSSLRARLQSWLKLHRVCTRVHATASRFLGGRVDERWLRANWTGPRGQLGRISNEATINRRPRDHGMIRFTLCFFFPFAGSGFVEGLQAPSRFPLFGEPPVKKGDWRKEKKRGGDRKRSWLLVGYSGCKQVLS